MICPVVENPSDVKLFTRAVSYFVTSVQAIYTLCDPLQAVYFYDYMNMLSLFGVLSRNPLWGLVIRFL